jgi:hypothetical protein
MNIFFACQPTLLTEVIGTYLAYLPTILKLDLSTQASD